MIKLLLYHLPKIKAEIAFVIMNSVFGLHKSNRDYIQHYFMLKYLYQQDQKYYSLMMLKLNKKAKSSRNHTKKQLQRSSCSNGKPPKTSVRKHKKGDKNKHVQQWSQIMNDIDRLTTKIQSLSRSSSVKKTQKQNNQNIDKINKKKHPPKFYTCINDSQLPYNQPTQLMLKQSQKGIYKVKINRIGQQSHNGALIKYCQKSPNIDRFCSNPCHQIMKQINELKVENERLTKQNVELQKKIFVSQFQRKQIKKKLKTYHKQQQQKSKTIHKNNGKNNHKNNKNQDFIGCIDQDKFFHSIQLYPNAAQSNRYKQQFSTQAPSVNLKAHQLNNPLNNDIINLSNRGKSKGYMQMKKNRIRNQNPETTFDDVFQYNRNIDSLRGLQQYFDKLVARSRQESKMIKKKEIWKQMKQIAGRIKKLRQIKNIY